MNRYTKSFALTSIFYILVFVSIVYAFDTNTQLPSSQTKSEQIVKFTIIQEQKIIQQTIQKIVKKEIIEKPIEKIVQKEVITKKIKPIEKKIVKKIIKKTPKIENKIVSKKQPIQKKKEHTQQQTAVNQIKKNKSNLTKEKNNLDEINKQKINQKIYYTKIKELINKNKYYPKVAVKRGIEGIVEINFTISKTGELLSFKVINGKKVFKKSICDALESSFPFPPPKGLLTSNTNLSLKIDYRLY
ncbi:MAG: energy transducer TonB [Arcobacteraceae bacterium]